MHRRRPLAIARRAATGRRGQAPLARLRSFLISSNTLGASLKRLKQPYMATMKLSWFCTLWKPAENSGMNRTGANSTAAMPAAEHVADIAAAMLSCLLICFAQTSRVGGQTLRRGAGQRHDEPRRVFCFPAPCFQDVHALISGSCFSDVHALF